DIAGAGSLPVGSLVFDDRIVQTVRDAEARLAPTAFTAGLVDALLAHYRPGVSPAEAMAGWLDTLMGTHGLVVFDASDPSAKPLAAGVFRHEIEHPCEAARLAREAGARMQAAGHAAQIDPADDLVCLFRVDDQGRWPVRHRDGRFTVGDREVPRAALLADVESHPEYFSPNVLLRPVVQDVLFPTVCYVGGPAELAYHAQLGRVYAAFDVPAPLVASR